MIQRKIKINVQYYFDLKNDSYTTDTEKSRNQYSVASWKKWYTRHRYSEKQNLMYSISLI